MTSELNILETLKVIVANFKVTISNTLTHVLLENCRYDLKENLFSFVLKATK